MSREPIEPELPDVEAILRLLGPTASRLDFGRVMYLAGQAAADRRSRRPRGTQWPWPCATAASLLAAVTFAALWAAPAQPEVVERIVYVEREQPTAAAEEAAKIALAVEPPNKAWEEYARLQHAVLTQGLEGLPEAEWRRAAEGGSSGWPLFDDALLKRLLGG